MGASLLALAKSIYYLLPLSLLLITLRILVFLLGSLTALNRFTSLQFRSEFWHDYLGGNFKIYL